MNQFLERLFGEYGEEVALAVFEQLQHAFLFELLAVNVLHEEFVAGEVARGHHLLDVFGQVDVIPQDVVGLHVEAPENVHVEHDGICLAGVDEFDLGLALFRAEYFGIAYGLDVVLVGCGYNRKKGAYEHSDKRENLVHSLEHVYNIVSRTKKEKSRAKVCEENPFFATKLELYGARGIHGLTTSMDLSRPCLSRRMAAAAIMAPLSVLRFLSGTQKRMPCREQ